MDKITQFIAITDAPRDAATSFLEMTSGNLELAITLYLETRESNPATPLENNSQVSGEEAADTNSTLESDAELARQLAQEEEPGIRAPIAPKREILVGNNDYGNFMGEDSYHALESHVSHIEILLANKSPKTIILSEDLTETTRLADIYRPPFDIMSKENFDRTRNEARNKQKWLMVDIQEGSEFRCLQLNRDLWSDKTVKDVIREHFLFLQFDSNSTEGRRYINFYPFDHYPHIAIIDPRTGERMKIWSSVVPPSDFLIAVTDFLERWSLSGNTPKKIEKSTTENQQSDTISISSVEPEDELVDQESRSEDMEEDQVETSPKDEGTSSVSVFDSIRPVERTQVQGPNATTIKFRLAGGKTVIRRFGKTDPVRYLFEYIKVSVPEAQEQPFELVCYSDNLINKVDQTVEEAGLSNAVVNMVFA
ncbi:1264_t:CDS:10 [Acaulospora morrowiae]|uniref:1264_t:CDS:1 n=1 Tax=Acaulospora morrowiae TaxID=94023 RepID=A0A9N9CVE5_9GLOM|nr:1264_t:CDS:10 [Acaulospora morrowiae]